MTSRVGIFVFIAAFGIAQAQTNSVASFEVASVKPSKGIRCRDQVTANGVTFCDVALGFLIAQAYHVSVPRVVAVAKLGYDKNLLDEGFDITAKTDHPATKDEVWLMIQALLADRFKLALHHEERTETIYNLIRTKDTGKLHPAGRPDGPTTFSPDVNGYGFTNQTMESFCRIFLTGMLDAQVSDRTQLSGSYDFLLKAEFPEGRSSRDKVDAAPVTVASIITNVEELGLQLQPLKGLADYIVVDHVEKPSEN
jgi:uncharacterized protein (TIGR03435 family)